MSNRTYICADCRIAKRAEAGGWTRLVRHRCPQCGKALCELSPKYCIPAKRDDKGWGKLKDMVECYLASYEEKRKDYGRNLLGRIDRQLELLEQQNADGHRTGWLEDLRKERTEVRQHFFPDDPVDRTT